MKINGTPLQHWKDDAVVKVNTEYARRLSADSHRAAAHARKRELAKLRLQTDNDRYVTPEFIAEAAMRGLSTADFARGILSRGSELDQAELKRQKIMAMIDNAANRAEIDAALKEMFNG